MSFILNDWNELLNPAPWTARRLQRCVSVGDYIYMTGGNTNVVGTRTAECWRSRDGVTWELLTVNPGWPARCAHGFVYYNNKFWIFGGSTNGGFLHDVWSSDDCITWVQETAAAAWSDRHEFGFCLHNGEIYLSGGYRTLSHLSDVWKTSDMVNWTLVNATIGTVHREHVLRSFNNNLYAYVGDIAGNSNHRVYRSIDNGVNWTYLGNPAWGDRREHQCLVDLYGSHIAIVGGYDSNTGITNNEVWEAEDGETFTQIDQINAFTVRSDFGFIHHDRFAYIIGGSADGGVTMLGDVWSTRADPNIEFTGNPLSGRSPLRVCFTLDYQNEI